VECPARAPIWHESEVVDRPCPDRRCHQLVADPTLDRQILPEAGKDDSQAGGMTGGSGLGPPAYQLRGAPSAAR